MKVWGLGIFLTVLMFTTVFSQEQSAAPRTITAIESQTADKPSPEQKTDKPSREQKTAASPRNEAGASLSTSKRPANLSELTIFVRDSMMEPTTVFSTLPAAFKVARRLRLSWGRLLFSMIS